MTPEMVRRQSEVAYNQWCVLWRENAKTHSQFKMPLLTDLALTGVGKAVLCIADGYSFEENIKTIKKHQDNVDILVCDKALGHCLDNNIIPKYCIVCDANVNYEKYLKSYESKLQDTIAIINVCANPQWSFKGNWKDKYYFVNKDILKSEKEFCELSNCKNVIPAGTNVSNAMIVMLTQSDDTGKKNFFGYDKILLIGYDYSWRFGSKYYSFNEDGDGKAQYMKHIYCMTVDGDFAYTSGNLHFSAQWIEKYITTFNLPVIQCSRKSILSKLKHGSLDLHMQYRFKPEDSETMRRLAKEASEYIKKTKDITNIIKNIEKKHFQSFIESA